MAAAHIRSSSAGSTWCHRMIVSDSSFVAALHGPCALSLPQPGSGCATPPEGGLAGSPRSHPSRAPEGVLRCVLDEGAVARGQEQLAQGGVGLELGHHPAHDLDPRLVPVWPERARAGPPEIGSLPRGGGGATGALAVGSIVELLRLEEVLGRGPPGAVERHAEPGEVGDHALRVEAIRCLDPARYASMDIADRV